MNCSSVEIIDGLVAALPKEASQRDADILKSILWRLVKVAREEQIYQIEADFVFFYRIAERRINEGKQ